MVQALPQDAPPSVSPLQVTLTSIAEFTAPVALASTYCTLFEHFFSNILPILLGVLLLRSHWVCMIQFFCTLELGTLATHSGYNIPFSFLALTHDWHHVCPSALSLPLTMVQYSFTENYGPLGIMDAIHGSDRVFQAWMRELRARDNGTSFIQQARVELAAQED